MPLLLKVAVVYPTSLPWMAELLDGIRRYGLQHGGWQILSCPPSLASSGERSRSLRSLVGWQGDAAIAAVRTAADRRIVRQLGIPVVNISGWEADTHGIPRVSVNNQLAGRLAAEHLLNRGLKHLAYVGWSRVHYSDQRFEGFARKAEEAGVRCWSRLESADVAAGRTMIDELRELGKWLGSLPHPCGVFAVHDYRAQLIIEACTSAGLRVPRDVAVIGMDDDAIVCEHATPTLTSVCRSSTQVGWEIGALIEQLVGGDKLGNVDILVPPDGISERQSTDMFHHPDEVVQLAVSFIRRNLGTALKTQAVADHAGVSKRTLETRFRASTGKSPHRYLTDARIEHAKKQIERPSKQNLRTVSEVCGFASYPAFVAAFQSVCGMTPSEYHRKSRRDRTDDEPNAAPFP